MKQIQWFPGHMAKAFREMQSQIDAVDLVIEILDARIPFSSRNPEIVSLVKKKPVLLIMSKADLASKDITNKWVKYYEDNGYMVIASSLSTISYLAVKDKCQTILKEKREKDLKKGLRPRPIRALVVGIPNVGKSTFINKLAKRKATVTGNKPGVTKAAQYVKIDNDFVLLDSPGVLWPNFEDPKVGINLALIGSIRQDILPKEKLINELLSVLTTMYKDTLAKYFNIDEIECTDEEKCIEIIERIAFARSFKKSNNELDIDRTISHILKEFSDGKMGKFSLEVPNGR